MISIVFNLKISKILITQLPPFFCKIKVYKNAKALAKHVQTCKNKNHTEDICIEIEE